jgi:hypothetical protein
LGKGAFGVSRIVEVLRGPIVGNATFCQATKDRPHGISLIRVTVFPLGGSMKRALFILLLLSCFAYAKDWQTGKLVSVTKDIDVLHNDRIFTLEVERDGILYVAERTIAPLQRAPLFTEGEEVRFVIDGDKFIAVEEHGREFRMKLLKKRRL